MTPDPSGAESPAPSPADGPPAIEDHALIGDTRTAALVTSRGEIDWMCAPRFESPPVFGSLVGGSRGGRFAITPREHLSTARRYLPGSAVLETTWATATGRARLTDGMVADPSTDLLPQVLLVRRLEGLDGDVTADLTFDPRRDLGEPPQRAGRRAGALVAEWGSLALLLRSAPDMELVAGRSRDVTVSGGEAITFVLAVADRAPGVLVGAGRAWELLQGSDRWWRAWAQRIEYEGPCSHEVERSLITLRLLTYAPSGAPVAAPTTSLPQAPGGEWNWDYRFSWPRDASLGLRARPGAGYLRRGTGPRLGPRLRAVKADSVAGATSPGRPRLVSIPRSPPRLRFGSSTR